MLRASWAPGAEKGLAAWVSRCLRGQLDVRNA